MEATVDPPSRGSRLDADHPLNGVLIPRRFTEQGRERQKERKADTRGKILADAAVLNEAEQRPDNAALLKLLDRFLTRPHDRALFNLPTQLPDRLDTTTSGRIHGRQPGSRRSLRRASTKGAANRAPLIGAL
jgi:hypothetical protein